MDDNNLSVGETGSDQPGMVWIPGGEFRMGSDEHYPEEKPSHRVRVDGFWMDIGPVTNRQFDRFVASTGHVTFAEIAPMLQDYPGASEEMLQPGSMVFTPPPGPVPHDVRHWWSFVFGANWRQPLGPGSGIEGLEDHPVVHVGIDDVRAYAAWSGKQVPTEAEWEFAALGGRGGTEFAWGNELTPDGQHMANTWQGLFPWQNLEEDGYVRTSPVGAYPANGYGLLDMIGNVWEWTDDWFTNRHPDDAAKPCCVPRNPQGGRRETSIDPGQQDVGRMVLKGGSHLCAPSYCRRYRPAARHPHPVDTTTSHIGFRCIVRPRSSTT
ncbi:formylglycine-generating enzyme family protein [Stenotrophomonas sp. PFBMAA-4]|uniref:formylglycine-generating enzyme family protein n=1 Tax=Stenotrophomonas sp. PFBMAA-4 TaxID=3043301 RepID=UPI0024B57730|nr:formylglycine-generating enzyme family protein [Stenotrophomonas sp. PFBMAA-4]MDI9271822.1 formylglycine-generating enzyme family protein [Stenotrophomonas sp. PFBMAA-4]